MGCSHPLLLPLHLLHIHHHTNRSESMVSITFLYSIVHFTPKLHPTEYYSQHKLPAVKTAELSCPHSDPPGLCMHRYKIINFWAILVPQVLANGHWETQSLMACEWKLDVIILYVHTSIQCSQETGREFNTWIFLNNVEEQLAMLIRITWDLSLSMFTES